ncbi:MAG TPA: hypothetical protein VK479_13200 [Micropepsaceae bacterium]|nr:hypothetical protein [Micropepsaceae bacterium]
MTRRAIYAGTILLTLAVSDAGALESSTCVGADFDIGQTRSPTKLLTDCKVNGVENPADAQSYTARFDKGEKFHRTADNPDISLLDGPVSATMDVEVCNLSGVVGRVDLDPKVPREIVIPAKTCRPVGPVFKLAAIGGGSDKRSEWFGIIFRRETLIESTRGAR